jgi:exopolysaccharide biosynthesis polyprenyl glycosylphosphotransferase
MARRSARSFRERTLPLLLLVGDTAVIFGSLSLSWWLRYETAVERLGIDVPEATYRAYLPQLVLGLALLVATFVHLGLYDSRLVLRRYQSLNIVLKGSAFWFAAYLGVSLVLSVTPPISRLFAVIAFLSVALGMHLWRSIAYAWIVRSPLLERVQRRAIIVGWNDEARSLIAEIRRDPAHPFRLIGIVSMPSDRESPETGPPRLGPIEDLANVLGSSAADLVIVTRLGGNDGQLQDAREACERAYVEWKAVPGDFDIFLSGLRLQTIGRVPILGVEELAIERLFNRALKRATDIVGALVGLALGALPMALAAILIRRESPGAPAVFRQTRIGNDHRPFTLYKLRSMRPDAPASDNARQSTVSDDPRLLRIGPFLRRWNLDEIPQFWNVLRGDMSLVGPRPERPAHVDRLAGHIPHRVKPGMTGWAQVNGLRGESDLTARIQHDIYYIENWSIWLDAQILLLTLVRWRNTGA